MAQKKDNFSTFAGAAAAARENPYLQRLIEDGELRNTLLAAYGAARSAYGHLNNGKPAAKALFEDRKVQEELARAATALRDATTALRDGPVAAAQAKPKRRKRRARRSLTLVIVGGALALVLSKDLRSKVLDLVFGSEEEFTYSSATAPPTPAPAAPAAV